ncbi:hypothetical protein [Parabacteroides sp. PF5-9]|uniref:hypothetical protein n=1 Tax=Parabacteroides sp. PF5-9 TaxID=1742404 RepID=UPI0024750E24|nr:hypothetical protein [Parabacteroides sp. PF5-9]MDH6358899.1 hypothetical protein [Parabacteroides sp. PF5-9]
MNSKVIIKRLLWSMVCLLFIQFASAQETEKKVNPVYIGGVINATTKGISTIPNMTLGKPALVVDLMVGQGRLSFKPQFRFALEGKPWSFTFWGRYKLLQNEKWRVHIGAHPAVVFQYLKVTENGSSRDIIRGNRYLAGEGGASYSLTKNISVGPYSIYSRAMEKDLVRNTYYLTMWVNFSNIWLSEQYSMSFNPQIFYVKMDKPHGFYVAAGVTLSKKDFPVSVSGFINHKIKTDILVGSNLLWNVSVSYSFYNELFAAKRNR